MLLLSQSGALWQAYALFSYRLVKPPPRAETHCWRNGWLRPDLELRGRSILVAWHLCIGGYAWVVGMGDGCPSVELAVPRLCAGGPLDASEA